MVGAANDSFAGFAERRIQIGQASDLLFGLLAQTDVAQVGDEHRLIPDQGGGNREFDRKLAAVGAHGGNFEALAEHDSLAGCQMTRHAMLVRFTHAGGIMVSARVLAMTAVRL